MAAKRVKSKTGGAAKATAKASHARPAAKAAKAAAPRAPAAKTSPPAPAKAAGSKGTGVVYSSALREMLAKRLGRA